MNVFWVIAFDRYYPYGGLADVQGTFPTREEAEACAETYRGQLDFVSVEDVSDMLNFKRQSGVKE